MKKFIIAIAAIAALTSAASATDLPKKKAPAAPTPPVADVVAAISTDTLVMSYGQDYDPSDTSTKLHDQWGATYTHSIGPFSVGAAMSTTLADSSMTQKSNVEAQAGYKLPAFAGVVLSGKVGVGERVQSTIFPYYALYGNADYVLNDQFTINALSYRYRNAFDTTNSYESHQIGTGVTYNINKTYAVSAKVFRDYDGSFNTADNGGMLSLAVKF